MSAGDLHGSQGAKERLTAQRGRAELCWRQAEAGGSVRAEAGDISTDPYSLPQPLFCC